MLLDSAGRDPRYLRDELPKCVAPISVRFVPVLAVGQYVLFLRSDETCPLPASLTSFRPLEDFRYSQFKPRTSSLYVVSEVSEGMKSN